MPVQRLDEIEDEFPFACPARIAPRNALFDIETHSQQNSTLVHCCSFVKKRSVDIYFLAPTLHELPMHLLESRVLRRLRMYRIWQKLCAELIGTYLFVFFAAGVVCADQELRSASQPGFGPVGIALVRGLTFAILVCALSQVSGGHFNPAITIGAWVTRKIGSLQALFYGVAQILGAMAGAWTLTRLMPEQVWRTAALATPDLAADVSRTQGILLELLLTFFLVFIFFAMVIEVRVDTPYFTRLGGFAAGLAIFAGMLVGGPYTGACMNPAMALGTAVVAHHWANHGVYWAGPLLGGVIGGWIYHALFARES
jgi:MIP family channel proteins